MQAMGARLVAGLLAGLVTLLAAGWSMVAQVQDARLLAASSGSQIAPLPDGLLPPDVPQPPSQQALSAPERGRLAEALWREPLSPRLFNLLFADTARSRPPGEVAHTAAVLEQLGWRYTPAQQNIILRALFAEKFDKVLDRVDALLRRQKRLDLAYATLSAMEAIPEVHSVVLEKLIAGPAWRANYMSAISGESPPALLEARRATIAALLDTPGGLRRNELAPSLLALFASGRGGAAHELWRRHAGMPADGNLVYDPDFKHAGALAETGDAAIPVEWQLGQDLGYAAQASPEGVTITWDRRGVPRFLAQAVRVHPGRSYNLSIRGRSDTSSISRLLRPELLCGGQTVRFELAEEAPGENTFVSRPLPRTCDLGVLTIGGAVDTGSGGVIIEIQNVSLQVAT